jgi:hypothetical protein
VRVTNDVQPFTSWGSGSPPSCGTATSASGTIERAHVNGALLKLMLGDAADNRPAAPCQPLLQPELAAGGPVPGTTATLTVAGVKIDEGLQPPGGRLRDGEALLPGAVVKVEDTTA